MDESLMDEDTEEALQHNCDNVADVPESWFFIAGNLGFSARVLQEHFVLDMTKETDYPRLVRSSKVEGAMLMLRGCRMECLLKALYVALSRQPARKRRSVSTPRPEATRSARPGWQCRRCHYS